MGSCWGAGAALPVAVALKAEESSEHSPCAMGCVGCQNLPRCTGTKRKTLDIQHAGCKVVWLCAFIICLLCCCFVLFSQGHTAVKGKELKALKIQKVKGSSFEAS